MQGGWQELFPWRNGCCHARLGVRRSTPVRAQASRPTFAHPAGVRTGWGRRRPIA
jgi:hypothetical protein